VFEPNNSNKRKAGRTVWLDLSGGLGWQQDFSVITAFFVIAECGLSYQNTDRNMRSAK
jgi:hypothetical protein